MLDIAFMTGVGLGLFKYTDLREGGRKNERQSQICACVKQNQAYTSKNKLSGVN